MNGYGVVLAYRCGILKLSDLFRERDACCIENFSLFSLQSTALNSRCMNEDDQLDKVRHGCHFQYECCYVIVTDAPVRPGS